MYQIAITNAQTTHSIEADRLEAAVRMILADQGIKSATVSVAIVDDATIHRLNRDFLKHDEPTDVLSFVLGETHEALDGEIIASADTAAATAAGFGWTTGDELLLYVIHGTLHLLGFDDQHPAAVDEMRAWERHYLTAFGSTAAHDGTAGMDRAAKGAQQCLTTKSP